MPFIVLDGPEGAGKTTQIRLLQERLPGLFPETSFVYTREPGGSPFAEEIRALFIKGMAGASPRTHFGLVMAARFNHVETVIKPKLAEGATVISDRYTASSYAYQVMADRSIETLFMDHLKLVPNPHLTLILSVPVEMALKRLEKRGGEITAFDSAEASAHERLAAGYYEYYQMFEGSGMVLIDGSREPEEVHERILRTIREAIIK